MAFVVVILADLQLSRDYLCHKDIPQVTTIPTTNNDFVDNFFSLFSPLPLSSPSLSAT